MSEQRIVELEQQLLGANGTILKLTEANAQLMSSLAGAETRNKKLKRSARSDERSHKEQLAVASGRRF